MPKTSNKTKKTATSPAKRETTPKSEKVSVKKPSSEKVMSKTAPKAKTAEKPKSKVPFKKEITQKLLDAKAKILQEVTQKVKSESNVLKHEIGDIYDIASIERERELTLMLGDRDRDKLSEIEDALERIKDASYGACEECGEPIAEDRLRALPFTRVCVECQSKNERELKIKGGRYEEESGLGIMERSESDEEEF